MAISTLQCIGILALTAGLLYLLAIRYDPQRAGAKYLRYGVSGLLLLCVWNLLPLPPIGVNPLSAFVTGALGLPGVGLMAVVNLPP